MLGSNVADTLSECIGRAWDEFKWRCEASAEMQWTSIVENVPA